MPSVPKRQACSQVDTLYIGGPEMYRQVLLRALLLLFTLLISRSALGGDHNSPKILFTYKDKQYSVEFLTGVSDKEITKVMEDNSSKYDLKSSPRPEGWWRLPARSPWVSMVEATRSDYYQHHFQGLLEYFIEFEVFNLYKQRHPVDIKSYYRAELVEEAIRRKAELQDRFDSVILSALDEKTSDAEIIEYVKKNFTGSSWNDRDWTESLNGHSGFKRYRPYYAFHRRCFPWMVGGKPVPWVEHYCYRTLIRCHIEAEIERDKNKYIRMLEDSFGQRKFFVIRKAQDSDKEELLKLMNLVTDRKGKIARGGLEKINKTLQELNSPTRMELWFGSKITITNRYKIPEDRIKPRQFISLGKSADEMESYLYIFQELPTPHFKEYPSSPGNFLYGTAKNFLLRPLVEEVRASIKPAKGVTLRTVEEIITSTGGSVTFFDKMFGVKLPKVLVK